MSNGVKTYLLPFAAVIALWLAGFFGSPLLVQASNSYLGMKLVALSPADSQLPRFSLAALLTASSVCAALLFWVCVKWYRKSSVRIYLALLAATLVLAAAGIGVNLFQLQAMRKEQGVPTRSMLDTADLSYFEWGAWPIITLTVMALPVMFFLQPEDPDPQEDPDSAGDPSTDNIGQS